MTGRYVPPHLRSKPASSRNTGASEEPQAPLRPARRTSYDGPSDHDLLSSNDIHAYFWKDHDTTDFKSKSTLHSSTDNPHGLAWVLLFNGANPKWESDNVIFVKSNLDLLPAIETTSDTDVISAEKDAKRSTEDPSDKENVPIATPAPPSLPTDGVPVDHNPIAVFTQANRLHSDRCFKFAGWYKIARLKLLAPRSEALVRMSANKWETVDKFGRTRQRQRDAKSWEESMSHKWAVIKMQKDEQAMNEMGEPAIKRIEDDIRGGDEGAKKCVNEMLAELRMK